jgi:hypothetical protein
MTLFKRVLPVAAAAFFALPLSARATALSIVNVNAPAINCVFQSSCTVVVNDSVGDFTPPGDTAGSRLQSRTYPGVAPAPAAGDMAYEYRVDMTSAKGVTGDNCVTRLALDFGSVVKLPYKTKLPASVFVVTSGGLGSVGLASANQVGSVITFTFSSPVCPGATSFFFGLASKSNTPVASTAKLSYSLGGGATTAVRAP